GSGKRAAEDFVWLAGGVSLRGGGTGGLRLPMARCSTDMSFLRTLLALLALHAGLAAGQEIEPKGLARGLDTSGLGPQGVVRRFCQLDGEGLRLVGSSWAAFQPLVAWRFEPAWDHVALIAGYEVGGPYPTESGMVVEVRYSVFGQVSAAGQDD